MPDSDLGTPNKYKTALRDLVVKLCEVHEDPVYMAVWQIHQMHLGPYRGKTYAAELEAAEAVLADFGGLDGKGL